MSELPKHNSKDWKAKTWTKGMQMALADFAGNAAELVFLRYQESFDKTFPVFKETFKTVMRVPVQILQKPLEFIINHTGGSIEGHEARDKRMAKTEEERLEGLLDTTYHFSAALAVGWGTLMGTEKALSHAMKTNHVPNKVWWRVDAPVHLGIAAALGSSPMKPVTDTIKGTMKNIMTSCGWSEEKAELDSRFAIAYILPNYLTLIPTVASMGLMHYGADKGLLKEGKHGFEAIPGKSLSDVENPVARNLAHVLQKLGTIDAHKAVAHA